MSRCRKYNISKYIDATGGGDTGRKGKGGGRESTAIYHLINCLLSK